MGSMTSERQVTDDHLFPPSGQGRGTHFLRGDYVELLVSTFSDEIPPGTPGLVLDLTDPVAVDVAWVVAGDGAIVYDEVFDQDDLGRLTSLEFVRRRAQIANGERPPARPGSESVHRIERLDETFGRSEPRLR